MKGWEQHLPLTSIDTPAHVIDVKAVEHNLEILEGIRRSTGCRILLALKAFAFCPLFSFVRRRLDGVTSSSLNEARLGRKYFGKEVHICAPAYKEGEFDELLTCADHIVFNSLAQLRHFAPQLDASSKYVERGIRLNPMHSETEVSLYDPCADFSRLGVRRKKIEIEDMAGLDGLHFHTLCEANAGALARTLREVERQFGSLLKHAGWLNIGGGHHITRPDYDRELLCSEITRIKKKYDVQVYLEPGEAVVLNAGALVASVLDVIENRKQVAILDTSASAHMPDVLEMPYRPEVVGAGQPGVFANEYRLGGNTCLAGDIIGDYSFKHPLDAGMKLVFRDMAHYTMVKSTTFNGLSLPDVYLFDSGAGDIEKVYKYDYADFERKNGGTADCEPCE